ncbi:uncharacterized protein LOC131878354 isoform X2 [Tigriopus californicus]|uniref:uncharacterized protein LOC131878354 isoform X2 n=1 Tax=Tigriopus californicus TaxID=6832 RepID=UPI0027DA336A|nr:uncharacterized protein LOC131878354 isoform X2 [Tigriopus californicus]
MFDTLSTEFQFKMEEKITLLAIILVITITSGQASSFKTLESGNQCFYLSTVKKMPFGPDNSDELTKECAKMKLEPARMKSTDDFQAIAEVAECGMAQTLADTPFVHGHGENDVTLGGNPATEGRCWIFDWKAFVSQVATEGDFCTPGSTNEAPKEPFFICSKASLCDDLPCISHPSRTDVCVRDLGLLDYNQAKKSCIESGGTFANVLTPEDKIFITTSFSEQQDFWTSLSASSKTFLGNGEGCNNATACINGYNLTWSLPNGEMTQFSSSHASLASSMSISPEFSGHLRMLGASNLTGGPTEDQFSTLCEYQTSAIPKGPPEFQSNAITCVAPTIPAEAKMKVSPNQTHTQACPGSKLRLDCDAGGLNQIKFDDETHFDLTCQSDRQYQLPNPWPECNEFAWCTLPTTWPDEMETTATGQELQNGQSFEVTCKNNQSLMTKVDSLKDDLSSVTLLSSVQIGCGSNGRLNESVDSYTCTQDCNKPVVDASIMTHNWTKTTDPVNNDQIRFSCSKTGKKIVKKSSGELMDNVTMSCRVNGRFDKEIMDFACTDCQVPPVIPDGDFICSSPIFERHSTCGFICQSGYISSKKSSAKCVVDPITNTTKWDLDITTNFECKPGIDIVIGGVGPEKDYMDTVEMFAPGNTCHQKQGPKMANKLIGVSADFIYGSAVVCGGASQDYINCKSGIGGSRVCGDNVQCVTTLGGTPWCTGPKTKRCLVYDKELTQSWLHTFDLKMPRVYAASLKLPDGSLWILGGISEDNILSSTEIVQQNAVTKKWETVWGVAMSEPKFGHCAMLMPDQENVLVTGGFNRNGFVKLGSIFNLITKKWNTKEYYTYKDGHRMDHSCGTFELNGAYVPLVIGGSNEIQTGKVMERFNSADHTWSTLEPPLNKGFRSGVATTVNGKLTLIGGVHCYFNATTKTEKCSSTSSALQYNDGTVPFWKIIPFAMNGTRSNHATMRVPDNLFRSDCKLDIVDGGYGSWSQWACSTTCGNGIQTRSRECDSPAPKNGGDPCTTLGEATETGQCSLEPCPPVNGEWSVWTDWGSCSVNCGSGVQNRSRECNNPAPQSGGTECQGDAEESQACELEPCLK